ncbi:hypothetical protein MATL_G00085270 [Megalops atlanticus]|uniref:SH3 domain-binding protein 2 n=1 Tax=Megalops atlanticus TaxID=7932 RepID=A0A9D3T825_MEGAT|nr:hypothetical protein MATL_G00085270 [Megalops atlanticus]
MFAQFLMDRPVLASASNMFRESPTNRTLRRRLSRRNMASAEIPWPVPMRAIGAQNLLTMPGGVSQSGYLHKKGGSQFSLLKWPLRFVILHKGCVYYFKSSTSPTPQGAFSLMGYNRVMRAAEETTSSNVFPFKIVHFSKKHRTWYFSAACEEERKTWMLHLRKEIDFYHDRKDSQVQSDSDSDADSFYGSIERPLEISYSPDTPEDDYVVEEEEDEDEDYLKPDGSPPSTDRPTVPPPAYPPPPVPVQPNKSQRRHDSSLVFSKGPPPPLPPAPTKSPPELFPKKPPPPLPPHMESGGSKAGFRELPHKGPPPPLPFAPHLQKPTPEKSLRAPKSPTPLPAAISGKKPPVSTMPSSAGKEGKPPPGSVAVQSPATLPICTDLEKKVVLSATGKPSIPPVPSHRNKTHNEPTQAPPSIPKPPEYKPPLPFSTKPKPKGSPLQRSSPDGQSFRSSPDEIPTRLRNKSALKDNDSDDDYENVQLPDSVFIDTTETSNVERLFKESAKSPQDGLYGIRNSGTKTSKVLVVWDVSLNKARNYRLFEEDSRIFLESELTFPSLSALVEYYYSHPLPNHGSLCLQKPYGYTAPR